MVEAARSVQIESSALSALADRLTERPFQRPVWRVKPHWWDDTERTAQYVFVLDALNFCFWGEPKWRVEYKGQTWDGYWALAACLRRAIDEGVPILDAQYMAGTDTVTTGRLLRGTGSLLLLEERAESLRQLGQLLLELYDGQAINLVVEAAGSAVALAHQIAEELPSFHDVATYDGQPVRLLKRAQILCSDLYGAYAGQGPGQFDDLDQLTAFADYKLPQILRELGVLVYDAELAAQVDARLELPAGSPEEIEIRTATVWAVELLRHKLAARGLELKAFEIDWYLWDLAQHLDFQHPYHRTRTVFY